MGSEAEKSKQTAIIARRLARASTKAVLGTLDHASAAPYTSLVTVALDHSGCPLLLLSELAWHTQNLGKDARASLLFDGTGGMNEPLEGPRVSYMGPLRPTEDPADRERFLARHPDAAGYAEFADFSFYRMQVERAHFVAGFGRIETIDGASLLVDAGAADAFAAAEKGIVEHMNEDHSDAVLLYATGLLDRPAGSWALTGCDADGCDLMDGNQRARLDFPETVLAPAEMRYVFKGLADEARAAKG